MLTVLCVVGILASSCWGGALKDVDVEWIPLEQRTADVGKSLSLGLGQFVPQEQDDQRAAASEFYAPVYSHLDYDDRQEDSKGEVGFYGAGSGRRGSSGRVSEDGYAGDRQAARGDRVHSGYYDDDSGARKAQDVGRASAGDQAFSRKGQAAAAFGARGGHRKGHHSSGFKNSYHKDESGNNSSFYDDANDEGGHYLYDARDGGYSDHGANAYRGASEDATYRNTARGRHDKEGAAAAYDGGRRHKGRYAQDDFYDDKRGYTQQRGADAFGSRNTQAGRYERPYYVGGYVSPTGIYSPKSYYPVQYKAKTEPIVSVYNGALKGKGYAEYEDTGVGNYYSDKESEVGRYDEEPSYYSSIN